MTDQQGLQWRPIEELEMLGRQMEELLAATGTQHEALRLSLQESRNVDGYALQRLTARLTVQRDDLWRIEEQLRRWLTELLTSEQQLDIQRLGEQMVRLYDLIDATLQLAGELERRGVGSSIATPHLSQLRRVNGAPRTVLIILNNPEAKEMRLYANGRSLAATKIL